MNSSRDKILFWCLLAAEAAGSQAILWNGIPIYRRLLSPGTEGAGSKDFVLATIAVIVMQVAHWVAFRLRPQLRFRAILYGVGLVHRLGPAPQRFPGLCAGVHR